MEPFPQRPSADAEEIEAAHPLMLQQFLQWAQRTPTAVAARHQQRTRTYAEVDRLSTALAHKLIASGVGPNASVAVCLKPSLDVLTAILAIYKTRGTYLPVDPSFPPVLIQRMLEEAEPRLVLTHSALAALTRASQVPQFCFDTAQLSPEDLPNLAPGTQDDGAYLLYTSGTTGKPKGVMATQGNLAHYLGVARDRYRFGQGDCFTSLARYTFSISLFDLLLPLTCGASVCLIDREDIFSFEDLVRHLRQVTVMHAGPSLLGGLFRYLRSTSSAPKTLMNLRHVSTGGDLVPPSVMEEMKRVFPQAEIFVIYGCTEISCMGTTFPVSRQTKIMTSFVGQPFPGVEVRLLDDKQTPAAPGEVGEIFVAGPGVSRGYLKQPELTCTKFVSLENHRGYLTGDLGRLHPDGNLEILGRRDFQVQLRGIRIELAGIEKTVLDIGLAEQCIVVARAFSEEDMRLVAFVVKPTQTTVTGFKRVLGNQLPDYMLPQHVVALEAMPLTANGKVDRNELKTHSLEKQLGQEMSSAEPVSQVEQQILEIFKRTLSANAIGVEDDFFLSGGHSLLAITAMHEIESAFRLTLPKHVMFESATARALAGHVAGAHAQSLRPILLNGPSEQPVLFMLSGIHIYRALARALTGTFSAYGVFAERELNPLKGRVGVSSVEEFAQEYVEIIRRQQPHGPYHLLGYSFAGIVAYEVAQQLKRAGEEIGFLALIDSQLPEWTSGLRYRWEQLKRAHTAPLRDMVSFTLNRFKEKRQSEKVPLDDNIRFADDPHVAPLEAQRDLLNRAAAEAYFQKLQPYSGPVTLITPLERRKKYPLTSRSCGWRPYLSHLEVFPVGGNHFSLMGDEPHVSQVGQILKAQTLNRTHQSGPISI